MRVSTPYQFGSYASNIANAQARYVEVQNQLTTGKRINKPSDGPSDVTTSISTRTLRAAAERYKSNIERGQVNLQFAEESLGETATLMRKAYEIAVRGANGATDQTGREGMVRELTNIQNRLVSLGNTRGANDEYIFGGQVIDAPPFKAAGSVITYSGDQNLRHIETGPGETIVANVLVDQTYMDAYNRLESLKNNLIGGNTGAISGVDISAIQDSMKQLNEIRGDVGSRLANAESMLNDMSRRVDDFSKAVSDIEDVDMAQAVVDLRLAETAYQAALSVASQGYRMSLMDFISG
jgi:flagellar hook-associated protein 3 FlgL